MGLAIESRIALTTDLLAHDLLAHERTLPLAESFADLFPEDGLVRGRTLTCTGPAATSLALALLAPVVAAGSWLGIVDVPTVGLDAASEFGLPLERVVAINREQEGGEAAEKHWSQRWPDVMAAAVDGFDVLLARVPAGVRPSAVRKLATRVRQRGAVVVVLGDPGPTTCDGVLHGEPTGWSGVGDGYGYLQQRAVTVQASGRRWPGHGRRELLLPAS
ncbi:MAG: hypothetical protein KUG57_05085 [Ilumatobacteraceae bacterium]|nr:hypothetical protein [Ilumatobacteraceae bacterium]